MLPCYDYVLISQCLSRNQIKPKSETFAIYFQL